MNRIIKIDFGKPRHITSPLAPGTFLPGAERNHDKARKEKNGHDEVLNNTQIRILFPGHQIKDKKKEDRGKKEYRKDSADNADPVLEITFWFLLDAVHIFSKNPLRKNTSAKRLLLL